eukprot:4806481-Alexandrium_andersonii.AAC.1
MSPLPDTVALPTRPWLRARPASPPWAAEGGGTEWAPTAPPGPVPRGPRTFPPRARAPTSPSTGDLGRTFGPSTPVSSADGPKPRTGAPAFAGM